MQVDRLVFQVKWLYKKLYINPVAGFHEDQREVEASNNSCFVLQGGYIIPSEIETSGEIKEVEQFDVDEARRNGAL